MARYCIFAGFVEALLSLSGPRSETGHHLSFAGLVPMHDVGDVFSGQKELIRLALGVGRAMTAGGTVGDLIRRLVVPTLHRLPGLNAGPRK